ncbi:MAG: hypothetical protein EOO24_35670, partial [Comamonadaceae bacterium]
MFERPHHQRIARALEALDGALLRDHACLFGGGTAMALRYGEYRESVDIDLLVSDLASYRALRHALTGPRGLQAILRADGAGVRLHAHEQHGVEALAGAVVGVLHDLFVGGAPGQRPRGVADQDRGGGVGVDEVPPVGRHPPEPVPLERGGAGRDRTGRGHLDRPAGGQAGVGDGRGAAPGPRPGPRGCEAHPPPAVTVEERRPPQHRPVGVGELHVDVHPGVRVGVVHRRPQP